MIKQKEPTKKKEPEGGRITREESKKTEEASSNVADTGHRLSDVEEGGEAEEEDWGGSFGAPASKEFAKGGIIDHKKQAVWRGFIGKEAKMAPSSADLLEYNKDRTNFKPSGKGQLWPVGTWTGMSLMANEKTLGGKPGKAVKNVPASLRIVQSTDNPEHAEFQTALEMSASKMKEALKAVEWWN
jgi:hypothetical protein